MPQIDRNHLTALAVVTFTAGNVINFVLNYVHVPHIKEVQNAIGVLTGIGTFG